VGQRVRQLLHETKERMKTTKINPANLDRRNSHELFMSAIDPRSIALVSAIGFAKCF
jgi:hypothetical protein